MNKRVKRLWLKALRGGKYQQGQNQLKQGRREFRYCCLGVLMDLAKQEGVIKSYRGPDGFLYPAVCAWAELPSSNPRLGNTSATRLNDTGKPFTVIADRIEKYL